MRDDSEPHTHSPDGPEERSPLERLPSHFCTRSSYLSFATNQTSCHRANLTPELHTTTIRLWRSMPRPAPVSKPSARAGALPSSEGGHIVEAQPRDSQLH